MKHKIWLGFFLALFVISAVGCSSCSGDKKKEEAEVATFATGFTDVNLLVDAYLDAITKKDPQLLKQLFLTPDEMDKFNKSNNRQLWQAYFMLTKRAFMDKNKDFLGQPLEKVDFTLGQMISQSHGVNIYRGSVVRVKLPDGKIVNNDLNFLAEAGGTWKILGLKYIQDEMQRRGFMEEMGFFEEDPKFKGVDQIRDVQIKVKKLNGPKPDEAPASQQPAPPPTE